MVLVAAPTARPVLLLCLTVNLPIRLLIFLILMYDSRMNRILIALYIAGILHLSSVSLAAATDRLQ